MTNSIRLPARLDLAASQKLVADVSSANLAEALTLDAADVDHLGALCAQAILAAARASHDAGGSVVIENLSDRVEAQLATMGLSGQSLMEGAR